MVAATREEQAPRFAQDDIWRYLAEVKDPEVPALSVVDLGIVRDVRVEEQGVTVVITPTYSGCPAMHVIEQDIIEGLNAHGVTPVKIETVFVPAWTSDWISEEGREKLVAYGIAAPGRTVDEGELITLTRRAPVPCPYCKSTRTTLRSEFGSTACKSINYCNDCRQPFEQFKAI
ncbi:MAG TPA: 1,2-phenylacetyl-CoA epoxidase subunit PaaD [Gemmatimonadaceae bacterium]|nr:1,2-phenylacetyl-CoA epoxidase subunit PaaD [Gemmatimonadaceae bacterium]